MTGSLHVVQVSELPSEMDDLVQTSLEEGFAFLQRLCDDWASGSNRFDQPGEVFLVARRSMALAGVCGLNRDPYSPDSSTGRIRRLYVTPSLRRTGVATALVQAALTAATDTFSTVRIRTFDRAARSFYQGLGFSLVESDPHATHECRPAESQS